MGTIEPLIKRPAWLALQAHHEKVKGLHLRGLFAEDPKRGARRAWGLRRTGRADDFVMRLQRHQPSLDGRSMVPILVLLACGPRPAAAVSAARVLAEMPRVACGRFHNRNPPANALALSPPRAAAP